MLTRTTAVIITIYYAISQNSTKKLMFYTQTNGGGHGHQSLVIGHLHYVSTRKWSVNSSFYIHALSFSRLDHLISLEEYWGRFLWFWWKVQTKQIHCCLIFHIVTFTCLGFPGYMESFTCLRCLGYMGPSLACLRCLGYMVSSFKAMNLNCLRTRPRNRTLVACAGSEEANHCINDNTSF